ncbi:hypothetical protein EON83_11085 [bacterium]|nr:MAG: hypothetical protein EON83_11085 [bacterium]
MQRARPDLYSIVEDFFLLLTVPSAFTFKDESEKWRRAIRFLSERWHIGMAMELKFAPQAALAKLFSKE